MYKGQNSSQLALIFTLCYRPDTHPFNPLYPCEIIMNQLYPTRREQRVLLKYSQHYNLFVFVFNSTEVRTETLTIFCVMILLLVDILPDFGLFRVIKRGIKTGYLISDYKPAPFFEVLVCTDNLIIHPSYYHYYYYYHYHHICPVNIHIGIRGTVFYIKLSIF